MTEGYPGVDSDSGDERKHRRQMARAINRLNQGKFNGVATLTLTANASSTVLEDARLTINSFLVPDPTTQHAMDEWLSGAMYCPTANRLNGSWTFVHNNNAYTDRIFNFLIVA